MFKVLIPHRARCPHRPYHSHRPCRHHHPHHSRRQHCPRRPCHPHCPPPFRALHAVTVSSGTREYPALIVAPLVSEVFFQIYLNWPVIDVALEKHVLLKL